MTNKPPTKRRRSRHPDGKYKGNDPTTDVNEAWEPVEAEEAVPKKIDHTITTKVDGISNNTAGKYAKKPLIKTPTFGHVSTVKY